jgi:hypothetical protein
MRSMRAALAMAVLLPLACSGGVRVRGGGGDPHYDFATLKTYTWLPRETTGDPRIDEPLLDSRVHAGVDQELGEKGYHLTEGNADFLVTYRAVLASQRSVESGPAFEGIWTDEHTPRPADGSSSRVDKVVEQGTIVLRIYDGKSRKLVWEASAETEIDPKAGPLAPTTEDKVRVAIQKMLDLFPP